MNVIERAHMEQAAAEIQKSGRTVQVISEYGNGAGTVNFMRCGRFVLDAAGDIDCKYERNPSDSTEDVALMLDVMSVLGHIVSESQQRQPEMDCAYGSPTGRR